MTRRYCFLSWKRVLWFLLFVGCTGQNQSHGEKDETRPQEDKRTRLEKLSQVLFSSISRVQEPLNCTSAKKLICSVNFHPLGFTNMMHMLVTCHLLAYGLGRVLVMTNLDFWSKEGDLRRWFQPYLSKSCGFQRKLKIEHFQHIKPLHHPTNVADFETVRNDAYMIKYEFDFNGIKAPFPYPPGTMPKKLKDLVKRHHRNPVHWYLGHFFKYHLLRPNANFSNLLMNIKRNIGFKHPIVGIHVRQGDKVGDEMNFIPEDHFIEKARYFFEKNSIPRKERRIFIATDTAKVVKYFSKTHANEFSFIHVESVDRDSAGSYYGGHYGGNQLTSLLVEMLLLIECDFNVVTFSSYVGKVVYLAKQAIWKDDASNHVISLDRRWFFTSPGYQHGPEFQRYCLFVRNGTSLKLPGLTETFRYKGGDYGRIHSRNRKISLGNDRTIDGVIVTHDRDKISGVVLAEDIVPFPRQPDFAEDSLFNSLIID